MTTKPEITMGRRIASRRALHGMSQEQLADRLGCSRVWVATIESDKGEPSLDILMKLAAEFGVTETWLLHGDAPPQRLVATA